LIRLAGYNQLTTATKALDDAGQRISHYLLMQAIVNGSFGLAVGVGVFLIGVPYAILWGFLAAVRSPSGPGCGGPSACSWPPR
jgi:predicted PurR-regulated permease PerM